MPKPRGSKRKMHIGNRMLVFDYVSSHETKGAAVSQANSLRAKGVQVRVEGGSGKTRGEYHVYKRRER